MRAAFCEKEWFLLLKILKLCDAELGFINYAKMKSREKDSILYLGSSSFPLEREEAVDAWAMGAALGAEASEATTTGETASDLAFLGGGSIKPSSLQRRMVDYDYKKGVKSKEGKA